MFRLPPPYLWTPPTPQRAKGYTPLTILKKKSKHKKASAAPVGASALTLFSLLHLKPLSRCATAPPRGSKRPPAVLRFRRKRRCTCRFPPRPLPVKMQSRSVRRRSGFALLKIIFPLMMRRAQRSAFQIVPPPARVTLQKSPMTHRVLNTVGIQTRKYSIPYP